jgi:hypothetical protein
MTTTTNISATTALRCLPIRVRRLFTAFLVSTLSGQDCGSSGGGVVRSTRFSAFNMVLKFLGPFIFMRTAHIYNTILFCALKLESIKTRKTESYFRVFTSKQFVSVFAQRKWVGVTLNALALYPN